MLQPSMERLSLTEVTGGFELSGIILQAQDHSAYAANYRITVDEAWTTKDVSVDIQGEAHKRVTLRRGPTGDWQTNGSPVDELRGIHDIDLEWSPSTNTLPIRRLQLEPGASATLVAAWVRFPTLTVERLEQTYERVDQRRYRYRSGEFHADLQVDADGLVTTYGANWRAVAASAWS